MKAKIFSFEKLIGTAELYVGDEAMGCLYGDFSPSENYYNYIQSAVWEFWSSRKPDYIKWIFLKLNVQLDNGYFLYATGGITFDDLKEFPEGPKRIDIAGIDRHVIEDFFKQEEPLPFVAEPWEPISIEQKILFEEELRKEIGKNEHRSFFNFLKKSPTDHVLANFEICALCHRQGNDDVLFVIRKSDFEKQFAVIHLTWRGYKEAEGYPQVEFFSDFDDFKYHRMYPDKAEWEY